MTMNQIGSTRWGQYGVLLLIKSFLSCSERMSFWEKQSYFTVKGAFSPSGRESDMDKWREGQALKGGEKGFWRGLWWCKIFPIPHYNSSLWFAQSWWNVIKTLHPACYLSFMFYTLATISSDCMKVVCEHKSVCVHNVCIYWCLF